MVGAVDFALACAHVNNTTSLIVDCLIITGEFLHSTFKDVL